ncbi:hypothetical protein BN2497_12107 [Janthinobacterium sp. CG23_2]|nr:hypothetical protein BN2497_12107 [Janthinobacterium sp. CG23_2]CUU32451.1 hypothetical protein BN3177_12107 [Janthinobacterium sp. CG23_2]
MRELVRDIAAPGPSEVEIPNKLFRMQAPAARPRRKDVHHGRECGPV